MWKLIEKTASGEWTEVALVPGGLLFRCTTYGHSEEMVAAIALAFVPTDYPEHWLDGRVAE